MRLLLGLVALLAALAGVGMLLRTQLKAIGPTPALAPAAVAAGPSASAPAALDTQRRIADDIGAALGQGAARREGDAAGEGSR